MQDVGYAGTNCTNSRPIVCKVRAYSMQARIMPTVLYASETWGMRLVDRRTAGAGKRVLIGAVEIHGGSHMYGHGI